MISKSLTSDEIIFIHEIIEENFDLPRGRVKIGELETLIEKCKGLPFSENHFDLFQQAAILFEGIVRLLVAAGCNINMRVHNPSCFDSNCSGLTPLGIAYKMDNPNIIQVLLEAGACE